MSSAVSFQSGDFISATPQCPDLAVSSLGDKVPLWFIGNHCSRYQANGRFRAVNGHTDPAMKAGAELIHTQRCSSPGLPLLDVASLHAGRKRSTSIRGYNFTGMNLRRVA